MARRERVGSAPGGQRISSDPIPAALQSPWGTSATPAAALAPDAGVEQHTEIAAFAPSPAPDSPTSIRGAGSHIDQLDQKHDGSTGQSQTEANPAQTGAGPEIRSSSELLGTAKQVRASKDHPLQQQKVQQPAVRQVRKLKPGTADVHLIGEITGAFGFGSQPLYCTWQLVYDTRLWAVSRGLDKGRTHASCPLLPEDGNLTGVVWETPVDLELTTTSTQHWPSIVFKLFHRSIWLGRDEFVGYSMCTLPSTPGCHHISCPVWAAVEARRSFKQELTGWFTGLTPQLVDESFITDLEQRYEQGQHLHTRDCSSTSSTIAPFTVPAGRAVECTGGSSIAAAGSTSRLQCRSFSRSGAGGTPAAGSAAAAAAGVGAGGRICLRLHVVGRGLQQLKLSGGESVGKCLERLRESVDVMRRQKAQRAGHQYEEEEVESEGVRMVREGRAARLAAAQQHLDGSRDRDQQGVRDSPNGGSSSYSSSFTGQAPGRVSPARSSLSQQGRFGGGGSPSSSWSGAGRFAGRAEPSDTICSPQRVSRVGRLGGTTTAVSSGRSAAATDRTAGDGSSSGAGWRAAGQASLAGSLSSMSRSRQQVLQQQDHARGAPRSPEASGTSSSEQQVLWTGARSAPVADAALSASGRAGDASYGGGSAASQGGLLSSGDRSLLRRGAQLLATNSAGVAAGVGGQQEGLASPTGSEGGGASPLLPYGGERSTDRLQGM